MSKMDGLAEALGGILDGDKRRIAELEAENAELRKDAEPVAWMAESGSTVLPDENTNPTYYNTPLYLRPAPIPPGMVLVPKEPTEAMVEAGCNAIQWYEKEHTARYTYRAMIAAAQGDT